MMMGGAALMGGAAHHHDGDSETLGSQGTNLAKYKGLNSHQSKETCSRKKRFLLDTQ